MGRRGSKINISGIKMHHFFVPELMAAAVLVKTKVFDQLLIIFCVFVLKKILVSKILREATGIPWEATGIPLGPHCGSPTRHTGGPLTKIMKIFPPPP